MKYEIVVGLEVHAELNTKTKIYCGCKNSFGSMVNSNCCPICTGMPGTLPTLNKSVVDYAVRMGYALHCSINNICKMDRKNYFYPDLPKAYQISQFDIPLCENGYIDAIVDEEGHTKRIGVTRIHIEEDAGKLIHSDDFAGSLVDFNRCGVPLIEIVSEPDMRSSAEAKAYLDTIKATLQYLGISDCKMQEGSIRCDVNVSVENVRIQGSQNGGKGNRTDVSGSQMSSQRSLFGTSQSKILAGSQHGTFVGSEREFWTSSSRPWMYEWEYENGSQRSLFGGSQRSLFRTSQRGNFFGSQGRFWGTSQQGFLFGSQREFLTGSNRGFFFGSRNGFFYGSNRGYLTGSNREFWTSSNRPWMYEWEYENGSQRGFLAGSRYTPTFYQATDGGADDYDIPHWYYMPPEWQLINRSKRPCSRKGGNSTFGYGLDLI